MDWTNGIESTGTGLGEEGGEGVTDNDDDDDDELLSVSLGAPSV